MAKTALISGITGQDGSYLAELLLSKDYTVHGAIRRSSTSNTSRIDHISNQLILHQADITDQSCLNKLVADVRPDEIYNLAAQSYVAASWGQPVATAEMTGLGVVKILEAIRQSKLDTRFYQASSSEMFGKVRETPQNENTPFYPRSPYGVAKAYGHYITVNYRESYGMFACSGILYNHESPRRGIEFVTKKVANAVARIKLGLQSSLALGNLLSQRDWGAAPDYVNAMWLMLQQDEPDDYVVATGVAHSVHDLVNLAFDVVGLKPDDYLELDQNLIRPAEVDILLGDASKARNELNWEPTMNFEELVKWMVNSELDSYMS